MSISAEQIGKAVKVCEEGGADVLYHGVVMKIHDTKKGQAKRILVVTNLYITYFKEKSIVPSRQHYWEKVKEFNIIDDRIELKFGKDKFRFVSPEKELIAGKILELMVRTHTASELTELNLSRFKHPRYDVNARGVLTRYAIIMKSNYQTPFYENMRRQVISHLPKMSFTEADGIDGTGVEDILKTVKVCPWLMHVKFPRIDSEKLFEKMTKFVAGSSHIKMFTFENEPAEKIFQEFGDALAKADRCGINALGFESCKLNQSHLRWIRDVISSKGLQSISFNDAVPEGAMDDLSNDFFTGQCAKSLQYIALNKSRGIDLDLVLPKFENLAVLSLVDCGINIRGILDKLVEHNVTSVRWLRLSRNSGDGTFDGVKLPPALERIDVDHVKWTAGSFPSFLSNILACDWHRGLALYCSKATIPADDWQEVFNVFENMGHANLVQLGWSHNKVGPALFNYIGRNKDLTHLFLQNCVSGTDTDSVNALSNALSHLQKLTHLILVGGKTIGLRNNMKGLLRRIKKIKSLKYLDISKNKGQDDISGLVPEIIREIGSLEFINVDENEFSGIGFIKDIIRDLEQRRTPFVVAWPFEEFLRLKKNDNVTEDELTTIRSQLYKISTGCDGPAAASQPKQAPAADDSLVVAAKGKKGRQRAGSVAKTGTVKSRGRTNSVNSIGTFEFKLDESSIFLEGLEAFTPTVKEDFPEFLIPDLESYFNANPLQEAELNAPLTPQLPVPVEELPEAEPEPESESEEPPKEEEKKKDKKDKKAKKDKKKEKKGEEQNEDGDEEGDAFVPSPMAGMDESDDEHIEESAVGTHKTPPALSNFTLKVQRDPSHAPDWTFTIPRPGRVSNKQYIEDLKHEFSTVAVINALKANK